MRPKQVRATDLTIEKLSEAVGTDNKVRLRTNTAMNRIEPPDLGHRGKPR